MGIFRPAWKSKDSAKAIAATQRTKSQKTFAHIAQEADSYYVRVLAASYLSDENLKRKILIEIAEKDVGYYDRKRAADELKELIDKKQHNEILDKIKEEMTDEEKEGVEWGEKKQKEFSGHIIESIKREDFS